MTNDTVALADPPHHVGTDRNAERGTHDALQLMRAEYLEMPGLYLTRRQAQRLWNLDSATCEVLLEMLIAEQFLKKTPDGTYALRRDGPQ
jgi:hypothetical protein